MVLGMDPGINGGVALVCSRGGLLEYGKLPTIHNGASKDAGIQRKLSARGVRQLLRDWSIRHAWATEDLVGVVEKLLAFSPSASSVMSMGYSAGVCEAVLSEFVDEILLPLPRAWKSHYGLVKPKGQKMTQAEYKRMSVDAAHRIFPQAGKISHDTAEAILLAQWGLGMSNGPTAQREEDDDPWARK